jgi:hypothetical protein
VILVEDAKHEETKPALESVTQTNEESTIFRGRPCQSLGRTIACSRLPPASAPPTLPAAAEAQR